jgi:hypothetical protein
VLGRTVVLRGSSGCLNTRSWSFHLVVARKTRVAGWCKGELLFFVLQVGTCMIGSWCFHPVGARETRELGVGARETRELVLPSSGC